MRTIFEQVISRGDYDLTAMLQNIDRYHIEGKLTDEDRESLYALAREGAQPVYDYAAEIEAIWAAIHELQGQAQDPEEWPEFVQPTGAHDAYAQGVTVTHNGKKWASELDGNTWEPGVYGWTEVQEPNSGEEATEG